jgi:hypothetical protein
VLAKQPYERWQLGAMLVHVQCDDRRVPALRQLLD